MSEECPCIKDYSNITIENQKEDDEKCNSILLPEKLLLGNTKLMKIKGLKMSSLGKKYLNNSK